MAALNAWNGGVIVISHDERFITTVAKEVSSLNSVFIGYSLSMPSYGCVAMVQSPSSGVMYKHTRFALCCVS